MTSVLILCGGRSLRLASSMEQTPKVLLPFGGRPLYWYTARLYSYYGLNDSIMCLGPQQEQVKDSILRIAEYTNSFKVFYSGKPTVQFLSDSMDANFSLTAFDTGVSASTVDRVFAAQSLVRGDQFCVSFGHTIADVDIGKLLDFHRSHKKMATVTLVRPHVPYAAVATDAKGRVRKVGKAVPLVDWVVGGYFVFDRKAFGFLSGFRGQALEREPLEHLAKRGELMAYRHDGFHRAIDTLEQLDEVQAMHDAGNRPWMPWLASAKTGGKRH